jgi:hypothetical protein
MRASGAGSLASRARGGARTMACAAAIALLVTGCATEERVVQARGGLYGLPGSRSAITPGQRLGQSTVRVQDVVDQYYGGLDQLQIGEPVEGWPNRRKLQDGSLYLVSRSPGELIRHLFETTVDGDWELMHDQLIAKQAKENYIQAGRDPLDIVRFLRKHRADFVQLLRLMGNGEHTPGIDFTPLGPQRFRLHSDSAREFGQRFSTMEVVIEDGRVVLLLVK